MKTSKKLAEQIRLYMRDNRYSIRSFADELKVSAGCVQGILKGDGSQIRDDIALRIGLLTNIKTKIVTIVGKQND